MTESSDKKTPHHVAQVNASPAWWGFVLKWVRAHKMRTILMLVGIGIVFELLTIPFFSVSRLKTDEPRDTALMRQRIREAEDVGKQLNIVHHWIPISRIPKHVIKAVVVAEDGTFYNHHGFDWYEVQESLEKNIKKGRAVRGASTITQQLAKNLYLSTSKDPIRKAKEALITVLLERSLSKDRILELYLNFIEWGRGIFGIEAAARTYFGKSAASLTLEEAIRVAAVIPSPLRHRPDENTRYLLRRKNMLLVRMMARRSSQQDTVEEEPSQRIDEQSAPTLEDSGDNVTDSIATDEGDHGL